MCRDVIYLRYSDFRQKKMAWTLHKSGGVSLQSNMQAKGEYLLDFNRLWKKALNALSKFYIVKV